MSKLVIDVEINEKLLKENDIIVYRDSKWQVISRDSYIGEFLTKQNDKNEEVEKRIEKLENNLLKLAQIVKEK